MRNPEDRHTDRQTRQLYIYILERSCDQEPTHHSGIISVTHALVLLTVNLHTKFKMSSFTHSTDMIGAKNTTTPINHRKAIT